MKEVPTSHLFFATIVMMVANYISPTHSENQTASFPSVFPQREPIYQPTYRERLLESYHGGHSISQLFADGDAEVLELLEAIPEFLRWKISPQEETPEALELLKGRLLTFWPPYIKEVKESQFEDFNYLPLEIAFERWITQHNLLNQNILEVMDEKNSSTLSTHIKDLYCGLKRLLILRQDVRVMVQGKSLSVQSKDDVDLL